MARKAKSVPSYLLHKQSGQARVRINGRDVLLGPYGRSIQTVAEDCGLTVPALQAALGLRVKGQTSADSVP